MSVWEQRQYEAPLVGRQASQGRERQPSVPRVVFGKLSALNIVPSLIYHLLPNVRKASYTVSTSIFVDVLY